MIFKVVELILIPLDDLKYRQNYIFHPLSYLFVIFLLFIFFYLGHLSFIKTHINLCSNFFIKNT